VSTADAVAREAAWLRTSGDNLPALLKAQGGPWDVVHPYWGRTPPSNQRGLYLLRQKIHYERSANIRTMPTYQFLIKVRWPILTSTGSAEEEQQSLDNAIELVVARIAGTVLDKTHGNRFLSVAENPSYIDVDFDDPEHSLSDGRMLRADIRYAADDFEISN
jgi:hypothetical protein